VFLLLAALAHATDYALADAGFTLRLDGSWHMSRWSDWDFDGRTQDGGVMVTAWTTEFQQELGADSARDWVPFYTKRLEDNERATAISAREQRVENAGGAPRVRASFSFELPRGGSASMHVATFAVDGAMAHVATYAGGGNGPRALRELDAMLATMSIEKKPVDLQSRPAKIASSTWEAVLPFGWRQPLPSEAEAVATLAGNAPEKKPGDCVAAVHPRPLGSSDLVLVCPSEWKVGILDARSFGDVQRGLKDQVLGAAADKAPDGTPIELTDRMGVLLAPGDTVHFAVVPHAGGTLVAWGVGQVDASLDGALTEIVTKLKFLASDGGKPVHSTGERVIHTLTYNPLHPAVIGVAVVVAGLLYGLFKMVFHGPRRGEVPSY
jgi:hypothetical protein